MPTGRIYRWEGGGMGLRLPSAPRPTVIFIMIFLPFYWFFLQEIKIYPFIDKKASAYGVLLDLESSDPSTFAHFKYAIITWLCLDTIWARMDVGHLLLPVHTGPSIPGTHWAMICVIRRFALTVSDVCLILSCFQSTSTYSALELSHLLTYWYYRLSGQSLFRIQNESLRYNYKVDFGAFVEVDYFILHNVVKYFSTLNLTRSQAVARIADRTAKNCRGHVT